MFARKKSLGERLKELFRIGSSSDDFYDRLEDILLEADLGSRLTMDVLDEVRERSKQQKVSAPEDLQAVVADLLKSKVRHQDLFPLPGRLQCFLFLGVNGVGKTTSIAKYAAHLKRAGYGEGIVFAAGDTFRAAATEQLILHGNRLGLRTVSQGSGADPGAVIFDAIESAKAKSDGIVLADTAGRLHNKAHLVKELEKIDKIVKQKITEPGLYKKVLVIDATTGQNGLQQAEVFHEAVGIDSVILSKYDSSARGGIVVGICNQLGLPISFIGTGESYEDFIPFSPEDFAGKIIEKRD